MLIDTETETDLGLNYYPACIPNHRMHMKRKMLIDTETDLGLNCLFLLVSSLTVMFGRVYTRRHRTRDVRRAQEREARHARDVQGANTISG
jgi:hypothetical protein